MPRFMLEGPLLCPHTLYMKLPLQYGVKNSIVFLHRQGQKSEQKHTTIELCRLSCSLPSINYGLNR